MLFLKKMFADSDIESDFYISIAMDFEWFWSVVEEEILSEKTCEWFRVTLMDFEVMEEVLSLRGLTRYGRGEFGRSDFDFWGDGWKRC
jgi:hypothetical protein